MNEPETNIPRENDAGVKNAENLDFAGNAVSATENETDNSAEEAAISADELNDSGEYFAANDVHVGAGFLFSPGAGWLCSGQIRAGATVNVCIVLGISLFLVIAEGIGFFPVPGILFLLLVTVAVWGLVACLTKKNPLRFPAGGWIWLSAVSALSFWMPFVLAITIGFGVVMQRTYMNNDSMMPQIHKGDCVLVDRLGYMFRRPVHGDLLMVEEVGESKGKTVRRVYFARVMAIPGDKVLLSSGTTYVNDAPIRLYYPQKEMQAMKHGNRMVVYELPHGIEPSDEEPARWYPITLSATNIFSQLNETVLDDGVYFVYVDNRDNGDYQEVLQSFGTIHESWIKGQPKFVLYNTEDEDTFSRFGYRLR